MKNTWRHYLRRLAATTVVCGSTAWSSAMCYAVTLAYDDASDPVYNDGWQAGDDGGTGILGPWNFSGTYDSTVQQAMDDGAKSGATDSSPYNDIGRAWTMYNPNGRQPGGSPPNPNNPPSGGTDIARAGRALTGNLPVGSTLKVVIDNPTERFFFRGWTLKLNNGGASQCYGGDNCTTPAFDPGSIWPRFSVGMFDYFTYGQWYMTDGPDLGVPLYDKDDADFGLVGTDSGVRIEFTLNTIDTFTAKMIPLDNPGATFTHSGTLATDSDGDPDNGNDNELAGLPLDWIQFEFYNTDSDFHPSIIPGGAAPGDYNGNGRVDAADYVVWRKTNGTGYDLINEVPGASPGEVTDLDYDEWKERFSTAALADVRATDFYIRSIEIVNGAGAGGTVPEPGTCITLLVGVSGLLLTGRRSARLTNLAANCS